jgi:bacillithiol system protein YtxJ
MPARISYVTSEQELDEVFNASKDHPVALLKHSNSCGISAHVFHDLQDSDIDLKVIVIQDHRDLSNNVAERIGHRHQSPQAFVIKDGKAVYHATHYAIDPKSIESALAV